jgi:outer membrane lipoprotein-sorting protein
MNTALSNFMSPRLFSIINLKCLVFSLFFLACLTSLPVHAQGEKTVAPQAVEEKAEKIVEHAIEAMGGSAYLNVRSSIGRGLFTQYKDGQSGIPSAFVDYIVFPDRERTEFKNPEGKIIQTNTGDTGWLYDGASKSIKDMTKAQVEDFKRSIRSSVDFLLRGFWRKEGARLSYAGRREAGLARRNETVRLTYPDGYTVDFEFGAKDYLPMKILYKRTNADGEELPEEDRMAQHVRLAGVIAPFVIDHYIAGAQTSRINYQSLEFNSTVAETLFARPASAKAVK